MTVLADSWYTRELPFATLEDQRLPRGVGRIVRSNEVARGFMLWWLGRRRDVLVLAGWGAAFKAVVLLERLFGSGRRYLVVLQFILVPEERWAALGRSSRLRARARIAAQQHVVAPVFRRALARAHVMSSWEAERNAEILGLEPSRFAYLPWPLVKEADVCPEYGGRGRRVLASGRTLCDWPTVFAAAKDQDWDLDVICTFADLPLVTRLNSDQRACVRHDLPLEEYREVVRRAAVHLVAVEECSVSTGHNRIMDAVRGGTPLVVSRVVGLTDYVEAGETALVFEPGDAPGARERVNQLLADPRLAEQLRTAAFRRARRWTHEQYMASIRALVEEVDPGR